MAIYVARVRPGGLGSSSWLNVQLSIQNALPMIPATPSSSFLLFFRESNPETYKALSAEQRQSLMKRWNAWYDELEATGKVVQGHPLEPDGRFVSAQGERVVDGPFAETKEAIGGYFFLTVADIDEATEIAKQCPSLVHGLTVEVRPIADYCRTLRVAGRKGNIQNAVT